MYSGEVILVSDEDSEVEVLSNTSSADKNSNANITTRMPIIFNRSKSINKESYKLKTNNDDEFVSDDDYHNRLMQELSNVLAVRNLNFDHQSFCPSTSDNYVPEPSYENIFVSEDNQSNDFSDRNHIQILKVESLSEWEEQYTDNQSEHLFSLVDDKSSGKKLEKKSQATRHELNILNKYLPVVQLTKVSLPYNNIHSENFHKKQLQVDNTTVNNVISKNVAVEMSHTNDDQEVFEFECKTCKKTFYSNELLSKHIKYHIKRIHTKKTSFVSSHPPYTFAEATSRDLERLSKMERTKNKYYKCTICNFKTGTLRCLNNHLRRFHNDKTPYICTECSYSSTNLRALNVHINHHFAKETYRCSQCTYSTACNSDLLSHIEIHKSKKYKCDICRSLFSKQESFSKHKLDNHTVFPFNQTAKCEFCDDQFTNKYNKKLHLMTHEHKNKKFRKCNRCIYITLSVKQFKKHMDEHKFNRLFICNDCSKSFPLKKLLVQHRSNFHYEINN